MDTRWLDLDGERLRALRRERAITQEDIERDTGVSQATLSALELGKRRARASTVRKLAKLLSVEPKELLKR